ncbi:MAG: helix-turn-helix transcriptional regulator, partial [Chitinophagaceae bacterium]
MSNHTTIKRYLTIIRKLQKSPVSFQDLQFHLENESQICGYPLSCSQRTLQRDIIDIESLFDIRIRNDRTRNVYYIEDETDDNRNIPLLELYELQEALHTAGNYSPFVFFENRKPEGLEHFHTLLSAAKGHKELQFDYQKFYQDTVETRIVHPFALKQSHGRWYLIAKDTKDNQIKTFGLDRLTDPKIINRKFDTTIPELKTYFEDCFGIINPPEIKPQKVILLFTNDQGKYIQTYPLHSSQRLTNIDEATGEMTFEMQIKV